MIEVHLDPADFAKWKDATFRMEKQVRKEWNELPRKCSVDYYQEVHRHINGQIGMHYPPYDKRYAEWKQEYIGGGRDRFWELVGDLQRNLTSWRVTDRRKGVIAWMGGVPSNVRDTGGKSWFGTAEEPFGPPKPIAMYGHVMEFGGSWPKAGDHPPRPIFGPVTEKYMNGRWIRRCDESMKHIRLQWRKL